MTSKDAKKVLSDMANFWDGMCKDSDDLADACRTFAEQKADLNQEQISKVQEIVDNFMPFYEDELFLLLDILDDIEFYGDRQAV